MKKPTTIAESTAKCTKCVRSKHGQRLPCTTCNGTGYACGVKPTEVERELFAIFEATKRLIELDAPRTATFLRYCALSHEHSIGVPTEKASRFIMCAEMMALDQEKT